MKAPQYREYVHHVRTERGTSTYQIRKGMGENAEVVAAVAVHTEHGRTVAYCTACNRTDCHHAVRILARAAGGK